MAEQHNPRKGWFYVALKPKYAMLLLMVIQDLIKSKKLNKKYHQDMRIVEHLLEGACISYRDISSEE